MPKFFNTFAAFLCLVLASVSSIAENTSKPETPVFNTPTPADGAKINQLLANYTNSVSNGDRAGFEAQLLALDIPFSNIATLKLDSKTGVGLHSIQNYAKFRAIIFESGKKYRQRFSNVKIEQTGNMAQVSLDYETAVGEQEYLSKGWKVIQLIKYDDQWKIVSELYTGYPVR